LALVWTAEVLGQKPSPHQGLSTLEAGSVVRVHLRSELIEDRIDRVTADSLFVTIRGIHLAAIDSIFLEKQLVLHPAAVLGYAGVGALIGGWMSTWRLCGDAFLFPRCERRHFTTTGMVSGAVIAVVGAVTIASAHTEWKKIFP
jgi:hypothetical protein